jgi:signal transduction histidine kinase
MGRLIRDLLDARHIELGQFTVDARAQELKPLIEEAVEPLQAAADEKAVRLETRYEREAGRVLCDRARVVQVLHNLIGNALKFVPEGGHVNVATGPRTSEVRLVVEDDGPGIQPEDLPRVFDRYWQATSTTLRRGSGLGLFIVKNIVDAHGGRIWVESAPGAGARFSFTLPAA